ncbi:ABC transporter ATP-binding protein [Oceanobacillus kimchii]|uniref:ABC transporter ATP-binding protein n=1 Tax=Oceanobacillus kimchii TaxID=746691 RepID=UPI00232F869C|nr:ABC transporter ATP-binding protein [Oceanobacillus kimchii]
MIEVKINHAGYHSEQLYLSDIQFSIPPGETVGLLGANGAGKSTTIKSIIGTIEAFDGEIIHIKDNHRLAYIPEEPILYDHLTLWEHLRLAATSYDLPEDQWIPKAEKLLKLFLLNGKEHLYPTLFSKGMRQKSLIVLSFMIQADIYIIDEPFIGLDPIATKNLITLLEQEKQRGAAILMTTHVLDSAEKLCDTFVLLHEGRMLFKGNLIELQQRTNQMLDSSLLDCFYCLLEEEVANEPRL